MKIPTPNPTGLTMKAGVTAAIQAKDQRGKCLLVVSDEPERLQRLQSAFYHQELEMTKISSVEELLQSSHRDHDLAIVDVEPGDLAGTLKTLRETGGHERIPVLVERSRLTNDRLLAGILPAYRAMPCSVEEMIKLAQGRLTSPPLRQRPEPRAGGKIL